MSAQNQPWRHHYLPCMLLSRFGEGKGRKAKVWMWDKQTGTVARVTVEKVAFEKNLYTLPTEVVGKLSKADRKQLPKGWDDEVAFERMFGFVETDLAKILDLMQEHKSIPPKGTPELDNLIVALVLFDLRTPAKLEEARVLTESTMNLWAKEVMDADPEWEGKPFSPISVPFKSNSHKLLMQVLDAYKPLVELMRERNWSIRISDRDDLAISDHPVNITFARQPERPGASAAPAERQTIVMFPLAQDMLLTGEYEVESAEYDGDERFMAYQNTVTLAYAERYVFTRNDSFPMLSDGKRLPAYEAMYESDEHVFTMTPSLFATGVKDGRVRKPKRLSINGVPADEMIAGMKGALIGGRDASPCVPEEEPES